MRTEDEFFEMLRFGLETYFQGGRRKGNTEHMIGLVRHGDTIVVPNKSVHDEIIRILRERRMLPEQRIRVQIVEPNLTDLVQMTAQLGPARRYHFDHTWLQAYVTQEAMAAGVRLERLLKDVERPDVI